MTLKEMLNEMESAVAKLDIIADNSDRVRMGSGAPIFTQTGRLHRIIKLLQKTYDGMESAPDDNELASKEGPK